MILFKKLKYSMEGKNSKQNSTASVSSGNHARNMLQNTLFDIGALMNHSLQTSNAQIKESMILCNQIQAYNSELKNLEEQIQARKALHGFQSRDGEGKIEKGGHYQARPFTPFILTQDF